METITVTLSDRKVRLVVNELNKVLDSEKIIGQTFNKQVIKALILDNLTRNTTISLMEELNNLPISEWGD